MARLGSKFSYFPLRFGKKQAELGNEYLNIIRSNRSPATVSSSGNAYDSDLGIARIYAGLTRYCERSSKSFLADHMSDDKRPVELPDGTTVNLSILERWESILGIVPNASDDLYQRRQRVKFKLTRPNRKLEDAARNILGDWFNQITYANVSDIDYSGKSPAGDSHAYWATNVFTFNSQYPGEYTGDPWESGISVVGIWYNYPTGTPIETIKEKVKLMEEKAFEICDAWVFPFCLATTTGDPGFTLDQDYLDLGGLLWLIIRE